MHSKELPADSVLTEYVSLPAGFRCLHDHYSTVRMLLAQDCWACPLRAVLCEKHRGRSQAGLDPDDAPWQCQVTSQSRCPDCRPCMQVSFSLSCRWSGGETKRKATLVIKILCCSCPCTEMSCCWYDMKHVGPGAIDGVVRVLLPGGTTPADQLHSGGWAAVQSDAALAHHCQQILHTSRRRHPSRYVLHTLAHLGRLNPPPPPPILLNILRFPERSLLASLCLLLHQSQGSL